MEEKEEGYLSGETFAGTTDVPANCQLGALFFSFFCMVEPL